LQVEGVIVENKKLYRSQTDRILAGVCGGLGQYLGLDPTVIRVIFAVLTVFSGTGLLLYIILMLIIPLEPSGSMTSGRPEDEAKG